MKLKKNSPLITKGFVFLTLVLLVYLLFETIYWRDHAETLEAENADLNNTLALTQDRLASEKAKSASLENELEATKQTLDETNNSLNQCLEDLAHETELYENCTERNEELIEFLYETKDELENLSAELEGFEEQIEDSMSRFIENSNIENLSASLRYQIDKCSSNTEINAPCIPIVMKNEKQWSYKREEVDKLLTLDEMVKNKGGDCEDWSLYFKAAYNYLKEQDRPERYLVSAVPGIGDFQIYEDWYYPNAQGREVGTTNDNLYVICYDSHCIVAISDEEIENSEDIYKLRGAPAVEPQDGQYMFTIGNILAPDICTADKCDYYDIWIVITDDDIYDFHYNQEWMGYSDYYDAAAYYKDRVDAIKELIEQTAC